MYLTQFKRRYITSTEIQCLEEGDCWHIDSDGGETLPMMIAAVTCDAYYLESCDPGRQQVARFERHELPSILYEPVPESRCYH